MDVRLLPDRFPISLMGYSVPQQPRSVACSVTAASSFNELAIQCAHASRPLSEANLSGHKAKVRS